MKVWCIASWNVRQIPAWIVRLFVSALAAGPCVALAIGTLDKIASAGAIVLGYREATIPFSYLDEKGRPVGYSMDLCMKVVDAVKRELKRPDINVKYALITSATRLSALQSGEVDIECESATNTAERRKHVSFTIPTFISMTRILVREGSSIRSIHDLSGKTVVTTSSTTVEKLLKELNESTALRANLVFAKDHAESFSWVESGKADAFVMDDVLLFSLRASSGEPEKYEITGRPLSVEPLSLVFRKDDPTFKKLVDAEIHRVISRNEIGAIYQKWFESPIPPRQINLRLPMSYILRDSFRAPTDWAP